MRNQHSLPSWHRYPGRFTIVFGVLLLALFVIEHINGRFWLNDFRVYYGAGEALLKGEPLYGVAHGLDSGVFKYAPALAMFYALFALLPYGIAASIQFALIAIAFIDGSIRIDRLVREKLFPQRPAGYLPLFLTALVCVVHLHRELHLGNMNMLLLWVLVIVLERLLNGNRTIGAMLIGIAILAKPHFVVLLPLLVLFGKYRELGISIGVVVLGIVLPSLFLGPATNLEVHNAWFSAMAEHNSSLIYTGGDDYRSVNTIYSFLHRSVGKYFLEPTSVEAYTILGGIVLVFGAFLLWLKSRTSSLPSLFAIGYFLILALVPGITLTDTEHFLLSMPLVAYLIHHLVPIARPHWLPLLGIPILLTYGGNWEDALGPFAAELIHYGVLGIGNVFLILICGWLYARSNQTTQIASKAR